MSIVQFRLALALRTLYQVNIKNTDPSTFAADAPYFPLLPPSVKAKANIDTTFFRQLRAILFRVAIPSIKSKEAFIVALHSTFLVLRTVLSIAVARLDGIIVRDLVR